MRKSSFNRAALFATAAVELLAGSPAHAQLRLSAGPRMAPAPGPSTPVTPHSAGDAIAGFLVKGDAPAGARLILVTDHPALFAALAAAPSTEAGAPASGAGGTLAAADAGPAAAAPGERARPPAPAFPAPDPQSLLLLLVQLGDLTLSDGMAAYGSPDDPLLPVGELSRLLELDIDVSPNEGRIVGRIGEAQRSLIVDLATNTARAGPVQTPLAPGDVAVEPADIYVRASVLAKLLPLKFDVDARSLQMRLTATELLPIQGRLQRLARLRQATPNPTATQVMRVDEPYKFFTPPSFDVALGLGAQTIEPTVPARYDIRAGGDLFYMGLQAYAGSDDAGRLSTARVLLERRSLDGDLLGPLHAHVVGLGDVFAPGLSIGPRSLDGRGFALSTSPLDQTTVFNRIDLRGELPIGDDVELYVNDVLQGAQQTPDRGQYEFLNVPLSQGVNVIRIVTYGPRGQRSEETRVVNASGGLLRPGQTTFEFGAIAQQQALYQPEAFGLLSSNLGVGKPRVVAALDYGLTQYLTLAVGGSMYTDLKGIARNLYTGGLRTSIAGFSTQFDLAGDSLGGEAAGVGIAGRLLGANAIFRHIEYTGGLIDENNPEAELDRPLTRRTEVDVDNNTRFGTRVIPLSARVVRDLYADGGSAWITQLRASASVGSALYSSGIEYDRNTTVAGRTSDIFRGYLGVSTFRSYKWQVRGTLNYDAIPDLRISGLEVVADREINNIWSFRVGATGRLEEPRGLDLIAGTTTRTKFGDLALTGQYDTHENSWRFGAQMNFGVGYNPQAHLYELTRSGPGSGGSVNFHAFLDANGNGKFDPGELPVPGVSLDGGARRVTTDASGQAYLTGFGASPTARLLVGIAGVDNQQIKTPPTVVEFSPRPGGVTQIDYPIRPTGEVMVNVKLRRLGQLPVGLSATRVRLVDDQGHAVDGVTEFDGSVNFHDLPAGTYHLELDKDQAARLRLHLVAPVSVTIRPDGSISPDVSAEVEFEPRADTDTRPPG